MLCRSSRVSLQGDNLNSIGITCAICHSTVDNSLTFGIGHDSTDGPIAISTSERSSRRLLTSVHSLTLLGVSDATVRAVLNSWGPGKFDAQLILDGKAFNPQQVTNGVVTGTNVPGATLIPNAFGLAGLQRAYMDRLMGNSLVTGTRLSEISRCTALVGSSIHD